MTTKPIVIVGRVEPKYEPSREGRGRVGIASANVRCGACGREWTANEREGKSRWLPVIGGVYLRCQCGNGNALERPADGWPT